MYLYWPEQVPGSQVKKADQVSKWPTVSCSRETMYGLEWELITGFSNVEVMSDLDMLVLAEWWEQMLDKSGYERELLEPEYSILQCPIIKGSWSLRQVTAQKRWPPDTMFPGTKLNKPQTYEVVLTKEKIKQWNLIKS